MKIGVIGDSHQVYQNIKAAMENLKDVELIIHTGDHYEDLVFIRRTYNIEAIGVKGNCDYTGEDEIITTINGRNFFICHGDHYNVKFNLFDLYNKAKELRADVAIFGHTHIPFNRIEGNILFINPGSISYPRGSSSKCCCILELGRDINVKHMTI
ncbi:YfcE family phosphodiesterase [Alkaliphilus serpentinus]|uniref:Phosphoesterase n=1 Tax=Alkaliphilus serpentinus TaxID=1482731 RepID=A0A833M9J5_9FIRM|nr:metallophosphoesterase [Alkaliphilus serpentinus]KAB3530030.1 metallophosphoesterase [Alkaliphilus serpentinus]